MLSRLLIRSANLLPAGPLLFVCFIAAGCRGPAPEFVYVDPSVVQLRVQPIPGSTVQVPGAGAVGISIQNLKNPTPAIRRENSREVEQALREMRAQREAIQQRVIDVRREANQERLKGYQQELDLSLAALESEERERLIDESRVIFEKYSDEVGEVNLQLANLLAFPNIRFRLPPRDKVEEARRAKIESLQERLEGLNNAYRDDLARLYSELNELLKQVESEHEAMLNRFALQLNQELARQDGVELKLDESKIAKPNPVEFSRPAKSITTTVPSVPAAASGFASSPGAKAVLTNRLKLWAQLQGYVLSTEKLAAQRDATEEYLEWEAKLLAGRSEN